MKDNTKLCGMNRLFLIFVLLALFIPLVIAVDLSYNSNTATVNLTYDALNRVTTKNTSSGVFTYFYDVNYLGTLSNVTSDNLSVFYDYDDKFRVIKERRVIDGITFEKNYVYDSSDRLISQTGSGAKLDYIFNKQGKVGLIPNYVNSSGYNAFGSMVNKSYGNGLNASYSYNSANNRLLNIVIPNVQNLSYTYDNVGNILLINDAVNSRLHNLSYDSLDRLRTANVGSDRYVYSYNSLGNMMKIVKNNQSKKFIYAGLAHTPSVIIDGNAGVDVYNPYSFNTSSKTRVFEFYILNDQNTNVTNASWTVDLGNGQIINSSQSFNFSNNTLVLIESNYSTGGGYNVNISVSSSVSSDRQTLPVRFGTRAQSINLTSSNVSVKNFEFLIYNDLNATVNNVHWNCTYNLSNNSIVNLSGLQYLHNLFLNNFTTPGAKTLICYAYSNDGNESKNLTFTIDALEVEEYNVLLVNTSRRIVAFNARNYYNTVEANISITTNNQTISNLTNISSGDYAMVFTEVNYSTDGDQKFDINLSTSGYSDRYIDYFTLQGVGLENYNRISKNYTTNILLFEVRNNWNPGIVSWNLSNPAITNSSNLSTNQTVMVLVENNYTTQGNNQAQITATTSSFMDVINDFFEIRPLNIFNLQTLNSNKNSSIIEVSVENNLNAVQEFNWQFNSGTNTINSSTNVNITNTTLVLIEVNYTTDGVYKTTAAVNSSSYSDSSTGVVIR